MPTYQYRCKDCGHEFEEFQLITEDPISDCPACDGETHRIISGGAGLLFKGSGFYITDYRSDSYKSASKNESGGSSGGTSDSSGGASKESAKPAAESSGAKSSGKD